MKTNKEKAQEFIINEIYFEGADISKEVQDIKYSQEYWYWVYRQFDLLASKVSDKTFEKIAKDALKYSNEAENTALNFSVVKLEREYEFPQYLGIPLFMKVSNDKQYSEEWVVSEHPATAGFTRGIALIVGYYGIGLEAMKDEATYYGGIGEKDIKKRRADIISLLETNQKNYKW